MIQNNEQGGISQKVKLNVTQFKNTTSNIGHIIIPLRILNN